MSMFPALRQDGKLNPMSPEFDPFSDEAIGQRPARHVIADRRQDRDQAHWSATDDRAGDVPAHILNGSGRRAQ